jgi:hypothetical protein
MRGRWLALALAPLLVGQAVAQGQEGAGRLSLADNTTDRVDLHNLLFHGGEAPRLLTSELRVSGIDARDVQRTLQEYNRRSELAQISRDNLILAPYLLQRALDMEPDQLLNLRLSARQARLVFQVTWR